MVYCHMIYSPETKQNKTVRYLNMVSWNVITIYIQNGIIHSDYILCARWVLLVTPDSSSSLPGRSMRVLPPPLLLINCLSRSPLGGPGPPPFPLPWVDPISFRVQAPSCFFVGYTPFISIFYRSYCILYIIASAAPQVASNQSWKFFIFPDRIRVTYVSARTFFVHDHMDRS